MPISESGKFSTTCHFFGTSNASKVFKSFVFRFSKSVSRQIKAESTPQTSLFSPFIRQPSINPVFNKILSILSGFTFLPPVISILSNGHQSTNSPYRPLSQNRGFETPDFRACPFKFVSVLLDFTKILLLSSSNFKDE